MVGLGDGLDLQLAVDLTHCGVELERDLTAGGVKLTAHVEGVTAETGAVGVKRTRPGGGSSLGAGRAGVGA